MEMARFTEPVDVFALESWNGCDIVLDEFETMQEWIEAHSEKRIAERG